jgi:hypothetical protein
VVQTKINSKCAGNYLPHESEVSVKEVHCLMQSLAAAEYKGLFVCTPLTFLNKVVLHRKVKDNAQIKVKE